jgi:hypothetical protein
MSKLIKRAFLDTEDGQIHYRIGGEGEPLLLLHMNPRSFDPLSNPHPIGNREHKTNCAIGLYKGREQTVYYKSNSSCKGGCS